MGGSVGKISKANSEPNVVPLCDILLVLLIIFMVIMPVSQQGIDIKLPETSTTPPDTTKPSTAIMLTVQKNGDIMINKQTVSKQMLESELNRIFESRSDDESVVFVQGDKSIAFKEVMSVIDIAKGAGIAKVALIPEKYPKD
jgi:biopolymer transport protein ExbD